VTEFATRLARGHDVAVVTSRDAVDASAVRRLEPLVKIREAGVGAKPTLGLAAKLKLSLALARGDSPAEMVLLPIASDSKQSIAVSPSADSDTSVVTYGSRAGRLSLVTIFLTRDWVGAEAVLTQGQFPVLHITKGAEKIVSPLSSP